jgi:hypothetical protein
MQQNNLHAHVNKCACFHIESCPSASLTPISQTHNQVLFKCLHPLTLASPVRPNMSISPPDSKLHSTSKTLPPILAVPLDTQHRNVTKPHLPPCARQTTKPRSKKKTSRFKIHTLHTSFYQLFSQGQLFTARANKRRNVHVRFFPPRGPFCQKQLRVRTLTILCLLADLESVQVLG